MAPALGSPHLHLRLTTSTNDRARRLAERGAPHGTIVTAAEQSAGRGRQGRQWAAPAGHSLLLSVVVRDPLPELLPLAAGLAVARAVGPEALLKWPNDVLLPNSEEAPAMRKVAGILTESRPQEGWAVVGIGVNVAVRLADLPDELQASAATMGLTPADLPSMREAVLNELERSLAFASDVLLDRWRERDALLGRQVRWSAGDGVASGIDGAGRLIVDLPGGGRTELDAGEVHLAGC